jgi:nucleotide-binding universal stress UspA family protein
MSGTIVCGVTDSPEGRTAAQVAAALSERLDLRLVLAHALDGLGLEESVGSRGRRGAAERALERIAREVRVPVGTEFRVKSGEPAELLAQIAAEEGADVVVVGSRTSGVRGRQLRCGLARELEAATGVPVLVAPPQTRTRSEHRLVAVHGSA